MRGGYKISLKEVTGEQPLTVSSSMGVTGKGEVKNKRRFSFTQLNSEDSELEVLRMLKKENLSD